MQRSCYDGAPHDVPASSSPTTTPPTTATPSPSARVLTDAGGDRSRWPTSATPAPAAARAGGCSRSAAPPICSSAAPRRSARRSPRATSSSHASTGEGLRELAVREAADVIVFGSDYRTAGGHRAPGRRPQRLLNGGPVAVAIAPAGLRARPALTASLRIGVLAERRRRRAAADRAPLATARSGPASPTPAIRSTCSWSAPRPGATPGRVTLSAAAEYAIETSSVSGPRRAARYLGQLPRAGAERLELHRESAGAARSAMRFARRQSSPPSTSAPTPRVRAAAAAVGPSGAQATTRARTRGTHRKADIEQPRFRRRVAVEDHQRSRHAPARARPPAAATARPPSRRPPRRVGRAPPAATCRAAGRRGEHGNGRCTRVRPQHVLGDVTGPRSARCQPWPWARSAASSAAPSRTVSVLSRGSHS